MEDQKQNAIQEAIERTRKDLLTFKKLMNLSDDEMWRAEVFFHRFTKATDHVRPNFFRTPLSKKSFLAGFALAERSRRKDEEDLFAIAEEAIESWKSEAGLHCARTCCDFDCECDGEKQVATIRLKLEVLKEKMSPKVEKKEGSDNGKENS